MSKMKSTKRALLMSALAIVMCLSMLIGSTFAWFTDSVTSGRNTIQSGNLDVKLEYSVLENGTWTNYAEVNDQTDIFGYDYWEPGYVAVAKFKVTNQGSLALKYQLTADVYEEIPGVNVAGETFYLSNFLYTEVVDADATREEILASTTGKRLKTPVNGVVNTDLTIKARNLNAKNDYDEVAMAIWMPTTVGNEANHNGTVPSISFGINLLATQQTYEEDSFDDQYDKYATYPVLAWGYAPVKRGADAPNWYNFDLLKANGGKAGSAEIPAGAIADDADNVSVKVDEAESVYGDITVASDKDAKTYDVTVTGLKTGNTEELRIELNVGAGLTGLKLYHEGNEVPANKYTYDANHGTVTFFSADFSPYTIVYDAIPVEEDDDDTAGVDVPVAEVTLRKTEVEKNPNEEELLAGEYPAIKWTGWGGMNPSAGDAQKLDVVYLFKSPQTSEEVDSSPYKDWYCDYYVKFVPGANFVGDVLPEGSITLGGNYEGYGWVGFDNPEETPVNTFIPLLAVFTGREDNLTYEGVCDFVQNFWCGVGKANNSTIDFNGAKFVVELRISDPNSDVSYAVNTVTYDFTTGESVITSYQG